MFPAGPLAADRPTAYPGSMLVLGHSGATGFGSNPKHPFQDARENSWATGTNPAVNSIYTRLRALNPAIEGHATNFAQDGATLKQFGSQVARAIELKPRPDLVVVQIGNNDIKCDGQDTSRLESFRSQFSATLQRLASGLPQARIFVVGQALNYDRVVKLMMQLSTAARLMHASRGICSIFAPQSAPAPGSVVPAHLNYVKQIMHGIDVQLAAACAQVAQCTYDGDTAQHLTGTAADLTSRLDHLSATGLAKFAALEWATMRRLHVIGG
jgi:lysophospholipase L1-like esterase